MLAVDYCYSCLPPALPFSLCTHTDTQGEIQLEEATFFDLDVSLRNYKFNVLHELHGHTKSVGNAGDIAAEEERVAANRAEAQRSLDAASLSSRNNPLAEPIDPAEGEDDTDGGHAAAREKHANDDGWDLEGTRGAYDLRLRDNRLQHRTRNTEMLDMFFRVSKYVEAIEKMTKAKVAARVEMKTLQTQLGELHKELVTQEKLCAMVSADHTRADLALQRRRDAQKEVDRCRGILDALNAKRRGLQERWHARDADVAAAKKNYGNLLVQVEALLMLFRQAKRTRDECKARMKVLRGRLVLSTQNLHNYDAELLRQYYAMQGRRVRTPFGEATVVSYDPEGDMLKLRLLWGNSWPSKFTSVESNYAGCRSAAPPGSGLAAAAAVAAEGGGGGVGGGGSGSGGGVSSSPVPAGPPPSSSVSSMVATVTMPLEHVIRRERARQADELRLMAQEDHRTRAVDAFERRWQQLERTGMNGDDHYAAQLRDVELLSAREEEQVVKALRIVTADCQRLCTAREEDEESVREYKPLADEIERRVGRVVAARRHEIIEHQAAGGPEKPKPITSKQIKDLRKRFRRDVEAQYLEAKTVAAERDVRVAYAAMRQEAAEQRALDAVFVEMLQGVMLTLVAAPLLKETAHARERAEDASGLVLRTAGAGSLGLPYARWRELAMQWDMHKWFREALLAGVGAESMVEMQARLAREQEAMLRRMLIEWVDERGLQEETFSVQALQAIWAREEDEAAQRAISEARERAAMAEAEREIRDVYNHELRIALTTRRAMAAEEALIRRLMAQEAYLLAQADQKGKKSKNKRQWDSVSKMIAVATMTSSKLARRQFLKVRHVDRIRQRREWPLMMAEDEFGFYLRADTLRMEAEAKAKLAAAIAAALGEGGSRNAELDRGLDAAALAALLAGRGHFDFKDPAFLRQLRLLKEAEWSESSDEEWLSGSDYEWETDDEAQAEKELLLKRAGRRVRRAKRRERRRQRREEDAEEEARWAEQQQQDDDDDNDDNDQEEEENDDYESEDEERERIDGESKDQAGESGAESGSNEAPAAAAAGTAASENVENNSASAGGGGGGGGGHKAKRKRTNKKHSKEDARSSEVAATTAAAAAPSPSAGTSSSINASELRHAQRKAEEAAKRRRQRKRERERRKRQREIRKRRIEESWRRKKRLPGVVSQRFLFALAVGDEDGIRAGGNGNDGGGGGGAGGGGDGGDALVVVLGQPASLDAAGLLPPAPVRPKPMKKEHLFVFWFRDLYAELLAAPKRRRRLLRQMDRLDLAPKRKARHLLKLDAASEAARMAVINVVSTQLEVARMREDLASESKRYGDLAHNAFKVGVKSRAKGYRELTLRRALERARAALRAVDEELAQCREDVLDAEEDLDEAQRELDAATLQTRFFDTAFIHGSMQRYQLDSIYPQLHQLTFRKLVDIVVVRAEVAATERQLRCAAEFTRVTAQRIRQKEIDLRQLRRNTRRKELLCTKRSFLAHRDGLFPCSRQAALATAFGGWVSLVAFKANIHKAFDLRYALLKQEQEVKLYKHEQGLADDERKKAAAAAAVAAAAGGGGYGGGGGDDDDLGGHEMALPEYDDVEDDEDPRQHPKFIRSYMHAHVSRRIRCKFCNKWFMEAQNHEMVSQVLSVGGGRRGVPGVAPSVQWHAPGAVVCLCRDGWLHVASCVTTSCHILCSAPCAAPLWSSCLPTLRRGCCHHCRPQTRTGLHVPPGQVRDELPHQLPVLRRRQAGIQLHGALWVALVVLRAR